MTSQTFFEDNWIEGNVPLVGSGSHAIWLGSIAFDGARAFEGVKPDLDQHCQRLVKSTEVLGMEPKNSAEEIKIYYTVKRGDTISKIAENHRVRIVSILKWNKLNKSQTIFPGQKLAIWVKQG